MNVNAVEIGTVHDVQSGFGWEEFAEHVTLKIMISNCFMNCIDEEKFYFVKISADLCF